MISSLDVAQAQDRLVVALGSLDDEAMRAPSSCDGWTRGHVLTHIARNADGMVNLAEWAQTGEVVAMYEPGRRDADIEEGATRPADEIVADVVASNERVVAAFGALEARAELDDAVAAAEVRLGEDPRRGPPHPARDLPFLRLQEVVVHHHDLELGTTVADWPQALVDEALPRAAARMAARRPSMPVLVARDDQVVRVVPGGGDPHGRAQPGDEAGGDVIEVSGPAATLLVWVLGRATAEDRARLEVSDGRLPTLPDW